MKKIVIAIIFAFLLAVPCAVFADGELSFNTDDGFVVFSDGVDECDGFGFAVFDGDRVLHLYIVGKTSQPFAAKLEGMLDKETEIAVFTESDGIFSYGMPYYVTNKTETISLGEIKAELINDLKCVVDRSLYRFYEQQRIDEIIGAAESVILGSTRRYSAEEAYVAAKPELLKLKTDVELTAEELVARKASAVIEISEFVDKSAYRDAEKEQLEIIIANAIEQINNAAEIVVVENILLQAKAQISELKTDAAYEAELESLKQSKISELNGLVNLSDYRLAEKTEIEKIIAETIFLIQSRTKKNDVTVDFETAKVLILAFKTDAELTAEELANKRASAIAELSEYVDKSAYRQAEKEQIEAIMSNATEQINKIEEFEAIDSVVLNAKNQLSALKTDAEYFAEELAIKRESAIAEVSEFVDKSVYRQAEKEQIEAIISNATEQINKIEEFEAIDSVVLNAKNQLSALKTDAEYFAEELAIKRESAIAELTEYVDKSAYRQAEKEQIEAIISNATGQINKTEDFKAIDSVVSGAKNQLSALKTDAQLYAEELESLKQSSVSNLNSLVNLSDYRLAEKTEIERIIAETTSLIQSRTKKEDVTADFEGAKALIMVFKTDADYKAEELAAAKQSAISELGGYLDKSLYRDAEKETIDGIIAEITELINTRNDCEEIDADVADAKTKLNLVLTDAKLTENAELNEEVVYYISKATTELENARFTGKGRQIKNIVVPIMKEVASDGKYGRIIVSPEYVKSHYDKAIENVKGIYNSMNEEMEKPQFEQVLAQLDPETSAFLKEYFL